jgi:hypothetical protein
MPGCGAIAGGGKGGCSGCEHPWIATAVLHPVMWPDASACAWAAVWSLAPLRRPGRAAAAALVRGQRRSGGLIGRRRGAGAVRPSTRWPATVTSRASSKA